ncbi:DUF547 domain-containing protein [Aquimarina hainanensis]|uniref:DUF547 domain-containing protein n=1 Tax=Aquimarina hainanensis TaxID=1578017 RepID=A0ABW5N1X6_9FLAO|nr:DUF547 domain-containing protein [Aquimarina sp. TRL1]QKX04287.1 DUF547 domain-containing protein [Aquimarina sp. TRL1]
MKAPRAVIFVSLFLLTFQSKAQTKFDHSIWDQILLLNVTKDGKVNYGGFMKDSSQLYEYFTLLSQNPPTEQWSKEEKLAYWINAYNAYTIKLVIDSYPISSIKDIKDPWNKKFFKINGEWYSLNDLEHKILRKMNDPRIHFAINCASFSCPVVWNRAYTGANVESALENQTKKFINDPLRNTITEDVVSVSKIFSWYKKDFKIDGKNVVDFINKYATTKIINQSKKGYKTYDWSLNE